LAGGNSRQFLEDVMSEEIVKDADLKWCLDILKRIKTIIDSKGWTKEQKLISIDWLVKQGLKAERE
jgi:hypothetical protein